MPLNPISNRLCDESITDHISYPLEAGNGKLVYFCTIEYKINFFNMKTVNFIIILSLKQIKVT